MHVQSPNIPLFWEYLDNTSSPFHPLDLVGESIECLTDIMLAYPEIYTDLEPQAKSMTIPNYDFHNFGKDKTEISFYGNQFWVAYHTNDFMSHYYAPIHDMISKKPFKVKFSWLNSKNNSELRPINWVGSGFLKTSVDFRIGKHDINKTLNSFSHKVKWVKGVGGVIQIFP
ncbi:hypothetical protein MTR67_044557 [Solanum verrucosum]|uniref:DUF3444 domain-containing protein n=1 Tax=Solanum verrucosum TaxID=315347 RepID=A0AAF0URG2_SOLVR|nr:hypothetical protein MTR67_044557 [Solanum verrucosum]